MRGQEYDRETLGRRVAFEAAAEDQATSLIITGRAKTKPVRYIGWDDPGLIGIYCQSDVRRIQTV